MFLPAVVTQLRYEDRAGQAEPVIRLCVSREPFLYAPVTPAGAGYARARVADVSLESDSARCAFVVAAIHQKGALGFTRKPVPCRRLSDSTRRVATSGETVSLTALLPKAQQCDRHCHC